MLFSVIKDETCIIGDETLSKLSNDMLDRDCDRFSILDSHSEGNESKSWQEEYQKMMLMNYRRLNCAK